MLTQWKYPPPQVQAVIQKLQNGEIEALPGRTLTETFEAGVNEVRAALRLLARLLSVCFDCACFMLVWLLAVQPACAMAGLPSPGLRCAQLCSFC